jgi:hypothetical protein
MTDLRLSNDFTLPAEAVTETFAILAKRGVGKTDDRRPTTDDHQVLLQSAMAWMLDELIAV